MTRSTWHRNWAAVPVLLLLASAAVARNDRPIVGILTLPTHGENCDTLHSSTSTTYSGQSCFATLYVDWIQSAGGRVAPIRYNLPKAELIALASSVNAILFTGGGLNLEPNTPYFDAAQTLFEYVLEANKRGVHLPLHGTCQGFQLLNILAANTTAVLTPGWNSENYSIPLNFTSAAAGSRMFRDSGAVFEILGSKPVTTNLHHDGVSVAAFVGAPSLKDFFEVLSINNDRDGHTFISTVEAFDFPITATQWHPERNAYEWTPGMNIDHSPEAIEAMQYIANFFVAEARKNDQRFASKAAEAAALIYNYAPDANGASYQCYLFE